MKSFKIIMELHVNLDTSELWPDKNGPANPTVDDVFELIEKDGGAEKIIGDWNLSDLLEVTVIENEREVVLN